MDSYLHNKMQLFADEGYCSPSIEETILISIHRIPCNKLTYIFRNIYNNIFININNIILEILINQTEIRLMILISKYRIYYDTFTYLNVNNSLKFDF